MLLKIFSYTVRLSLPFMVRKTSIFVCTPRTANLKQRFCSCRGIVSRGKDFLPFVSGGKTEILHLSESCLNVPDYWRVLQRPGKII